MQQGKMGDNGIQRRRRGKRVIFVTASEYADLELWAPALPLFREEGPLRGLKKVLYTAKKAYMARRCYHAIP